MQGVNSGDQLFGYHEIGRRSKKRWKKFSYVIEHASLNAYLLKKDLEPEVHDPSARGRRKRDFLDFHIDVAEQLIHYAFEVAILNLTLLTVKLLNLTLVYNTALNKAVKNEVYYM